MCSCFYPSPPFFSSVVFVLFLVFILLAEAVHSGERWEEEKMNEYMRSVLSPT